MKKTTKVALFFAAALGLASLININETSCMIAVGIIAALYITDRGFRRLFNV